MAELLYGVDLKTNSNSTIPGKYSDTYFRINTKAYCPQNGWNNNLKSAYEAEQYAIFKAHGWNIEEPTMSVSSMTAVKGRNYLYLHPQNYSGVCENDERTRLMEAFSLATTFSCQRVDVYHEIFDMTDEQLDTKLNAEIETITSAILKAFTL